MGGKLIYTKEDMEEGGGGGYIRVEEFKKQKSTISRLEIKW